MLTVAAVLILGWLLASTIGTWAYFAKSALPGDMYMLYTWYKRDEWEKFLATTSNWDTEMYLDCLP